MNELYVWLLIFAGAAVGLLGTFLIASESELKRKRREMQALAEKLDASTEAQIADNSAPSPLSGTKDSEDLLEKNRQLEQEVAALTARVEISQELVDELRAERQQSETASEEIQQERRENQELREVIERLKMELQDNASNLSKRSAEDHEASHEKESLQTAIAALNDQLEDATARIRELVVVQQEHSACATQQAALEERLQSLQRLAAAMEYDLAQAKDQSLKLASLETHCAELESLYNAEQQESRRLEQEVLRSHERAAQSSDRELRFTALRAHLDELCRQEVALAEQHHQFENRVRAISALLDPLADMNPDIPAASPFAGAEPGPVELETVSAPASDEPMRHDCAAQSSRRRSGTVQALILLAIAGAAVVTLVGTGSDEKNTASKPPMAEAKNSAIVGPASDLAAATQNINAETPALAITKSSRQNLDDRAQAQQSSPTAYEITRPSQVYSEPSESSFPLAKVGPGTAIEVVSARDGWLEIRSKHDRSLGFIREGAAIRSSKN